jgi:hypothetical protein
MLVILPATGQFETVEQNLGDVLSAVQPSPAQVKLALPKWESKSAIDLKPPSKAAGITDPVRSRSGRSQRHRRRPWAVRPDGHPPGKYFG